jgi:hypothetical protein
VLAGPTPRGTSAGKLDFFFRVSFKRKRGEPIREASPWAYRPVLCPTCTHRALSLLIMFAQAGQAESTPRGIRAGKLDFLFRVPFKRKR